MTPRLVERLKGLGVDPAKPEDLQQDVWRQLLLLAAEELFPTAARDEALRQLGAALLLAWNETLVGKALFTTLRVIGVPRGLTRLSANFRTSNSFTESTAREVGPKDFEVWVSDVNRAPSYIQGLLTAAVTLAGATDVRVEVLTLEGEGVTYRVRWT
jgi:uncharacterized protein (TIGR02265 family)